MITVRWPSGVAVTYNNAYHIQWEERAWHLFTKKDGVLLASIQVSAGVALDFGPPCKVRNAALTDERLLDEVLERASKSLSSRLSSLSLSVIRQLLIDVARSGRWK